MASGGPWDGGEGDTGPAGGRGDGADEVRRVVAEAVRSRPAMAEDPERLNGYLRDVCPHRPAEVAVIVAAARAGVPDELARASQGHAVEALSARLAGRLNAESGIDTELARWAVDTWALALGVGDPSRGPAPADPSSVPPPPPVPPRPSADDDDLRAMAARVGPAPAENPPAGPRPAPIVDEPTRPPPAVIPEGRTVHRKAAPAPSAPKEAKAPRRGKGLLVGAAALAVGLGVAAVLLFKGDDPDPTAATTVPTSPPTTSVPETTVAPTTTVTTNPPTVLPAGPVDLAPGFYTGATFQPRLTATIPEGWRLTAERIDYIELSPVTGSSQILSILKPEGALLRGRDFPTIAEARQPGSTEPRPSDFVAWLGTNSRLSVSAASPVTRAGVEGVQVDVTVSAPYSSDYCPKPCAALFQLENGGVFTLTEGNRNRIYVLDVGDRQILVVIESPPDELEAFVARADRIVESIAFTG